MITRTGGLHFKSDKHSAVLMGLSKMRKYRNQSYKIEKQAKIMLFSSHLNVTALLAHHPLLLMSAI